MLNCSRIYGKKASNSLNCMYQSVFHLNVESLRIRQRILSNCIEHCRAITPINLLKRGFSTRFARDWSEFCSLGYFSNPCTVSSLNSRFEVNFESCWRRCSRRLVVFAIFEQNHQFVIRISSYYHNIFLILILSRKYPIFISLSQVCRNIVN